jgi:hypothetical protein
VVVVQVEEGTSPEPPLRRDTEAAASFRMLWWGPSVGPLL